MAYEAGNANGPASSPSISIPLMPSEEYQPQDALEQQYAGPLGQPIGRQPLRGNPSRRQQGGRIAGRWIVGRWIGGWRQRPSPERT